ncbi:hypothetical protein ACR0ST_08755 [Aliidiomarina sp. Khilg15.8]
MIKHILVATSVLVFTLGTTTSGHAQEVLRGSGGSIQTELIASIIINENSSMSREWIVVNDSDIPVKFTQPHGVTTVYEQDRSRGDYRYLANFSVETSEDIAAFEVRFLTFDLWGNHLKNLSTTEIADVEAGTTIDLESKWRILSENEVAEFYATIGYVAQVRTADGRVLKADPTTVLEEAKQFSDKFSESDLATTE